jgi:hypothetical protein
LKSFVHDPVRSRIERFDPAIIAAANQDRDPAVDVSFVTPLPKCHFFHALSHAPLFADFTNGGFVFGGHLPIPLGLTRGSARGQMQKISAGKFDFEPPSPFTSFGSNLQGAPFLLG